MLIKYPARVSSWTTYLDPFDTYLWVSLFMLLFLMASSLFFTYLFGQEQKLNPESFNMMNLILIIHGSQVSQGSWIDPKSISSQIVILSSFLFGVILVTNFPAKLISFLTVIKLTLPFTSLVEISKTEFGLGSLQGTAILDSFLLAPPNTIQ